MATIALEQSRTTRLFWLIAALALAVIIITFKQDDPGIAAAGLVLTLVALLPLYLWLLGWSHGLPIWPVFAMINGITFSLALLQDPRTLTDYTPGEIVTGAMTMTGFILLGTLFWISFTARPPKAPQKLLMIKSEEAVRTLYFFIWVGILFMVNGIVSLFYLPGNLMQVARGVAFALNAMGIFTLSYYHGRGLLSKSQIVWLTIGIILSIALSLTSIMLASAVVPAALAIFGYMLGSNKMPWKALTLAIISIGLLHPGKYEMRDKYWGMRGSEGITLANMPQFFTEWFGYGLTHVGGVTGVLKTKIAEEEDGKTSAFERAGNAHMLLLVQRKAGTEVPFLGGITYEHIPRLLIPRFIDSGKGISHAGNNLLNVNFGLMSIEHTANVSIYWGLVPEAYANFGYLGVAALAFVLSLFFAAFTRASVGVPMTSLRFVLGLMVMAASTKADTMGIFASTQFQSMVGVAMAALVLMKRHSNPFAASGAWSFSSGNGVRPDVGPLPAQFAPVSPDTGDKLASAPGPEATEGLLPESGLRRMGSEKTAVGPVKWGGQRPPKWAPLSHRKAFELAAARRHAELVSLDKEEGKDERREPGRPRQVAVPIQPYYYRSRKA